MTWARCEGLRGQGARVIVTEIDPICAPQALMEAHEVRTIEDVVETADIFVTATAQPATSSLPTTCDRMKHHRPSWATTANFDNEIDMAGLARVRHQKLNIKPQVDQWTPRRRALHHVLSEGRSLNSGQRYRHPSFVSVEL